MTLDLDQIERRAALASLGPWEVIGASGGYAVRQAGKQHPLTGGQLKSRGANVFWIEHDEDVDAAPLELADAEFIAAAREDIPALLRLARSLLAEIEKLREES